MIVTDKVRKLVEKASNSFLFEVMRNKGRYIESDNFSTTQYMNVAGNISQLKFKELVIRALTKHGKNLAFLNMGVASGHLELANRLMGNPIHISSVEWDAQLECCEHYRNILGVQVDYICNDVLKDDFEIFDCETYFDFVILERFFPIYRDMSHERNKLVISKFAKYARKAVVIESDGNWSKDQWNYMIKISERRIKISSEWNCFIIDLEQFKDEAV